MMDIQTWVILGIFGMVLFMAVGLFAIVREFEPWSDKLLLLACGGLMVSMVCFIIADGMAAQQRVDRCEQMGGVQFEGHCLAEDPIILNIEDS